MDVPDQSRRVWRSWPVGGSQTSPTATATEQPQRPADQHGPPGVLVCGCNSGGNCPATDLVARAPNEEVGLVCRPDHGGARHPAQLLPVADGAGEPGGAVRLREHQAQAVQLAVHAVVVVQGDDRASEFVRAV
jgi:hypothetical protein